MIKEIALAITLGALLGFGITGGYLASQKSRKTTFVPTPTPVISIGLSPTIDPVPSDSLPDPSSTTASQLVVTSPKDEDIVNNSLLEVKGTASPLSLILINTNLKHYQTSSNDSGSFSFEVELESGINNIQIDAFTPDDQQSSTTFQVTYSTAKI